MKSFVCGFAITGNYRAKVGKLALGDKFTASSRPVCLVVAKFHYTDPTGPDRTRTDFFAARVSEKLRWVRAGFRQSPCGSVRVRVVEFSLCWSRVADAEVKLTPANSRKR